MQFPAHLWYTREHEWITIEDNVARIGITSFAQSQLGDIVFVDIPAGRSLQRGDSFGSIEAVKTVSELFLPVSGTIIQVNPLLQDKPELVNTDPYGDGWLIKLKPADISELGSLMNAAAYTALVG